MGFLIGLFTGLILSVMYAGAVQTVNEGKEPRVSSTPCETSGLPNKDEAGKRGHQ